MILRSMTRRSRARRRRGSALIVIMVMILIMMALAVSYATMAIKMGDKHINDEYKNQARTVALGGLQRAITELDSSVAGICSHCTPDDGTTATFNGTTYSCFGNIDGNMNTPLITPTSTLGVADARFSKLTYGPPLTVASLPASDTYDLDNSVTGNDGWMDFPDQTSSATAGIALKASNADGTYSVRCKADPANKTDPVTGRQISFRLRSYGVYKGQVAGFEALVHIEAKSVFRFAAFGDLQVSGSGSVATDSFKSGSPPDPGTTYGGTPTAYSSGYSPDHGDVASNGTVNLSGGAITVNGTVTSNAGQDIPPIQSPPVPAANTVNAVNTNNGTTVAYNSQIGSGNNNFKIGDYNAYTQGDIVVSSIDLNGNLDIYVAAGQTINVYVNGPTIKSQSGPGNGIVVHNPNGANPPGVVNFYIQSTVTTIDLRGQNGFQAVMDTSSTTSVMGPAAALNIWDKSTVDFNFSGGSNFVGAIYAPNASFKLAGGADIYGAVIASSLTITGNSSFHYDESLANVKKQPLRPAYRITSLVPVVPKLQ